jgi:hypothetical protein
MRTGLGGVLSLDSSLEVGAHLVGHGEGSCNCSLIMMLPLFL